MADIRINALATTASSTASDDFLAVDGSANGTRKLNAYSPTFGGNVVATGTLTVNSTTDSSSKDTGAIITEGGLGVEKSATIGGNLTVSGTGTSSFAGNLKPLNFSTTAGITQTASTATTGVNIGFDGNVEQGWIQATRNSNAETRNLQINPLGGNVLIGTTTDGGQKLQVSGTISGYNTSASTPTLLLNSNQPATGITLKSSVGAAAERSWAITTNTTSYGDFQIRVGTSNTADPITSGTAALTLDSSQNATFAGNIKTAAPSGGTAATWRLGTVASVSPTSPNRTIEVEIGGTTYYIHAKTTNN